MNNLEELETILGTYPTDLALYDANISGFNPLPDYSTFKFQQRDNKLKKSKRIQEKIRKINVLKLGNRDIQSILYTLPQEIIDHIVKFFWNNYCENIQPVNKYDYLTFNGSIHELYAFRNIVNSLNVHTFNSRFVTEEQVRTYLSNRDLPNNIIDIVVFYCYYYHFTPQYPSNLHFPYLYSREHSEYYVEFPKFSGININMMPIKLSRFGFQRTIPKIYRAYIPILEQCKFDYDLYDSVAYLTISEQFVEKGESHRRPGLHTESQGYLKNGSKFIRDRWGGFALGGIFMASNVSNTCKIYKADIPDSLIGKHGNIEYLRSFLDENYESFMPEENQLVWMKDTTPHESLPVPKDSYRQFFRLVCGEVSTWYEDHSTKNPLGVVPPKGTIIIKGSKFSN